MDKTFNIKNGLQVVNGGSNSAPAISKTTDTDTGMYWSGTNQVSIACNGTERLRVTTTGLSVTGTVSTTDGISSSGAITGTTSSFTGNISVGTSGAQGEPAGPGLDKPYPAGLLISTIGDIVDTGNNYLALRFGSGVKIYSGNKTGTSVITLSSTGNISAISVNAGYLTVRAQNETTEGGEIFLAGAGSYNGIVLDNLSGNFRIFKSTNGDTPFSITFGASAASSYATAYNMFVPNNITVNNAIVGTGYISVQGAISTSRQLSAFGGIEFHGGGSISGYTSMNRLAISNEGIGYPGCAAAWPGMEAHNIGFLWDGAATMYGIVDNAAIMAVGMTSDRRLKTNIKQVPSTLDILDSVNVIEFNPVTFDGQVKNQKRYGVIADEIEQIIPSLVAGVANETQYQSVDYAGFTPYLIKAVQELTKRVKILEQQIQALS